MSHINRKIIPPKQKLKMSQSENVQADSAVEQAVTDEIDLQKAPKTKKAKVEKADKADKPAKAKSDKVPSQPRAKRGPARPHRRLGAEVIDSRITKLQKRLDRAKSQIEDASRHVEGYLRERDFRAKEAQ
jgi:hypothetical protein